MYFTKHDIMGYNEKIFGTFTCNADLKIANCWHRTRNFQWNNQQLTSIKMVVHIS